MSTWFHKNCLVTAFPKSIEPFLLLLFSLFSTHLNAQDIHFSQFNFTPLNTNPANTNFFDGDYRVAAIYRNQWQTVPVGYNTFSCSGDMNYWKAKNSDTKIGGGLLFYYDQAGKSKLTNLSLSYLTSVVVNFGKKKRHYLSTGIQVGFMQRSFDPSGLKFDDQWNGDAFDPNLSTTESFPRQRFALFDLGVGMLYSFQRNERNNLTVGLGYYHANEPKNNSFFNNQSVKYGARISAHGRGQTKLARKLDLVMEYLYNYQDGVGGYTASATGDVSKHIVGGYFKNYLNRKSSESIAFNIGAYYRLSPIKFHLSNLKPHDAAYILVGMDYNNLHVTTTYDINISNFRAATNTYGAFEISAIYIWARIKPIDSKGAACPIF